MSFSRKRLSSYWTTQINNCSNLSWFVRYQPYHKFVINTDRSEFILDDNILLSLYCWIMLLDCCETGIPVFDTVCFCEQFIQQGSFPRAQKSFFFIILLGQILQRNDGSPGNDCNRDLSVISRPALLNVWCKKTMSGIRFAYSIVTLLFPVNESL